MAKSLHNCPSCGNELTRIRRTDFEKFINRISLGNYFEKKFMCYSCLKEFSFGKGVTIGGNSSELYSDSINTLKTLPAFLILLLIIGAMLALSNKVSFENINNTFSFFTK
jgi:hypothetical protein